MEESRLKTIVFKVFEDAYPDDVNISVAAELAGISRNTASAWVRVLTGEGNLVQTRRVGNAKMYRLSERPVNEATET